MFFQWRIQRSHTPDICFHLQICCTARRSVQYVQKFSIVLLASLALLLDSLRGMFYIYMNHSSNMISTMIFLFILWLYHIYFWVGQRVVCSTYKWIIAGTWYQLWYFCSYYDYIIYITGLAKEQFLYMVPSKFRQGFEMQFILLIHFLLKISRNSSAAFTWECMAVPTAETTLSSQPVFENCVATASSGMYT